MQIVIDIPEAAFEMLTTKGVDWLGAEHILSAVANGTVLPKGHGRLIDESALREDMERHYKFANELVALGFAESFLEHAPTIIEADCEVDE